MSDGSEPGHRFNVLAGTIMTPLRIIAATVWIDSDGRQVSRHRGTREAGRVTKELVGPFELRLLASINALQDQAFGSNLRVELGRVLEREVAVGQLYLSLSTLERRGFISSTRLSPTPVRGGRAKKLFRLLPSGAAALENAASLLAVR